MVVPPDRVPGLATTGGYEEILTEQAEEWLAQAAANVPDGIEATTHVAESFAQGSSTTRSSWADRGRTTGDGLIGRHSIGSVTGELLYSAPSPARVGPRAELGTRRWTESAR